MAKSGANDRKQVFQNTKSFTKLIPIDYHYSPIIKPRKFEMPKLSRDALRTRITELQKQLAAVEASKGPAVKQVKALMKKLGVNLIENHADFRLMSRRAIDHLKEYPERNIFLRGIVPMLGLNSTIVRYRRAARIAGFTKYPLLKMLAFAWEGVTSFSIAPLRLITLAGIGFALGSLSITAWALWIGLFTEKAVPGWTSTVAPLYFLGGIQLFALGVVGEYAAKIYLETKRRPSFQIETETTDRLISPTVKEGISHH